MPNLASVLFKSFGVSMKIKGRTKSVLKNEKNLIILTVFSQHLPGKLKGYSFIWVDLQEFVSCQVVMCYFSLTHWNTKKTTVVKKPLLAVQKINSKLLHNWCKAIPLSKHKEFQNKTRMIFYFSFIVTKILLR